MRILPTLSLDGNDLFRRWSPRNSYGVGVRFINLIIPSSMDRAPKDISSGGQSRRLLRIMSSATRAKRKPIRIPEARHRKVTEKASILKWISLNPSYTLLQSAYGIILNTLLPALNIFIILIAYGFPLAKNIRTAILTDIISFHIIQSRVCKTG